MSATQVPPESVMLDHALELADQFHAGATDKAGAPYVEHVHRVVDAVSTSEAKIVAALHDIVEDTNLNLEDLLAAGFSPSITVAVDALTRRKGESYVRFVRRAASHPVAREVKMADVADNADAERLALLDAKTALRLRRKYSRADRILHE